MAQSFVKGERIGQCVHQRAFGARNQLAGLHRGFGHPAPGVLIVGWCSWLLRTGGVGLIAQRQHFLRLGGTTQIAQCSNDLCGHHSGPCAQRVVAGTVPQDVERVREGIEPAVTGECPGCAQGELVVDDRQIGEGAWGGEGML